MAAKTNGKGCIYQLDKGKDGNKPKSKCRKWKLVVSVGKDPRKNGYRQKAKVFNGTYTQAQHELREFVAQIEGGTLVKRSGWTFSAYAKHYVDARVAAGEIQERTAVSLRETLKSLAYHVGEMRLQDITPEILEAAYVGLRNGDSRSGKPLCGRTLHNVNLSAYLLFKSAIDKGILSANPLDKVPMPKKDTKEKESLSAAAYRSLLSELDPAKHMQCAVLLCAALGLRRSEALGLSWGDVDFEEMSINIHASTDDHADLKEPKTEAGFRLLPMTEHIAEAFMGRKRELMPSILKYHPELVLNVPSPDGTCPVGCVEIGGSFYNFAPQVAVCCNLDGNRPRPHALSAWWWKNRKKYGLEECTLHELRHTFLSMAAAQGVHPSVMMRLAGHSSPNVTMQIYTHVNMESKRDALKAMQAAYVLAS